MSDTYGPIETMAEQLQREAAERRRCRTFTDPQGIEHRCVEQYPHPEVACHDADWVWEE